MWNNFCFKTEKMIDGNVLIIANIDNGNDEKLILSSENIKDLVLFLRNLSFDEFLENGFNKKTIALKTDYNIVYLEFHYSDIGNSLLRIYSRWEDKEKSNLGISIPYNTTDKIELKSEFMEPLLKDLEKYIS